MLEEEHKRELALLRLSHAKEQISYIPGILELGDYKTVANRSYYSVFYAMHAVLALDGYDSKKDENHQFAQAMVGQGIRSCAVGKCSQSDDDAHGQ